MPKLLSRELGVGATHVGSSTPNIASMPAASATLGPNLLTNSTFDADLSGWTAGTGWAWDAGTAKHTAGNVAALAQALTGLTSVHGYVVTITITGRTTGTVALDLGGDKTANIGGTATVQVISTASSSGTFSITPSTDFDGAIDSITMAQVISSEAAYTLDTPTGTAEAGEIRVFSSSVTALGNRSGSRNTTGSQNTAVGYRALSINALGSTNTAVGFAALNQCLTGSNTAVGASALQMNTFGSANTAVGSQALYLCTTASSNTALGRSALRSATTGSSNTAVGASCSVVLTTGAGNTAVGTGALANVTTGNYSTAVGNSALNAMTGSGPNTAIGELTYGALTTGAYNTAVGDRAGTYPGGTGAYPTTTASRQTLVGHMSGQSTATQVNDITCVGYYAVAGGNNAIAIGSGASAGAAGSVAIGKDSLGVSASTSTVDEIRLGTTNHTINAPGSITAGGYVGVGSTVATVGAVRLANNAYIYSRTSNGSTSYPVIGLTTADAVQVGGPGVAVVVPFTLSVGGGAGGTSSAQSGYLRMPNGSGFYARNAAGNGDIALINALATDVVQLAGNGQVVSTPTALAIGATPAAAGALRLSNTSAISWRNAANNGDVSLLTVNASNQAAFAVPTSAAYLFTIGAATPFRINTTQLVVGEAVNLSVGNVTGSIIAINSGQKLGFWGATPVVQNTGWSTTATYTPSKALAPETATLIETSRALGTLIDQLKAYGLLGG